MRRFNGGDAVATVTGAVEVAELATAVSGVPVFTWQAMYDPLGSAIGWSMRVHSIAELEHTMDKFAESQELQNKAEALNERLPGPSIDTLNHIVAGGLGSTPAKYVSLVTGTALSGQVSRAAEWGAGLAEQAQESMGVPIAFAVSVYGTYGSMSWISAIEDADALDTTRGKLMADVSLGELVDAGGEFMQPHATQLLLKRLG